MTALHPTPAPQAQNLTLPIDGLSRASQILPFLPFGQATLWAWAKCGKFPAPIKISPTVTAWRNKDVHDWLNRQSQLTDLPASNDDTNLGGIA